MSDVTIPLLDAPTKSKRVCELCGLPIIARPVSRSNNSTKSSSEQPSNTVHTFCCEGCARVWSAASEAGLTDLLTTPPASGRAASRKSSVVHAAGCRRTIFHIGGMWCASCALVLERALLGMDGVLDVEVSFASGLARTTYDPDKVNDGELWRRVELLGYRPAKASHVLSSSDEEAGDLFVRFFAGAVATMWVMWMSLFLLYPSYMHADYTSAHGPALLAGFLTTFVLLYPGAIFVKGALQAARVGRITMDTLVLVGTWSAYAVGIWSLATGRGPAYFDSAAMIVVVVLFGRWLEALARQKSSGALSSLIGEDALSAWVLLADGSVEKKSVESIAVGDWVITRTGERITVDGIIREGHAAVDQSSLTGEPLPAEKLPGDEVWAGTIMVSGSLTIEVARSGEETLLARMADLAEDAMFAKTNLQRWADLVASLFGPVVLAVAAATILIGAFSGLSLSEFGNRAVAVLVVACPCAVALATPMVAVSAIGRLTSAGLVLRSASILERAGSATIIGMDKTGTLTRGEVTVTDIVAAGEVDNISPDLAVLNPLAVAYALEAEATHPLAKAIVHYANEIGVDRLVAREVQSLPGLGVIGKVDQGFTAMVGSSRFIEKEGIELPGSLLARASAEEEEGHTVAWLAVDGTVIALLILADAIRPEAANVVKRLKAMGMQTIMVSGDARGPCRAVAGQIGIDDFRAEVLPHEKEQLICDLRSSRGRVAFAGDGVNDAAALASSDLAIAFAPGIRMAAEAADVIVTDQAKNPLSTLPLMIQVARAARTIIAQNLGWALMYNIVALPLAVSGVLSPVWAAIAMAGSSLAVVANSLRIRQYSVQK